MTRSSRPVPSRFARWILPRLGLAQYIFPPAASTTRPRGSPSDVRTVSMLVPLRSARRMAPPLTWSVQYILVAATPAALSTVPANVTSLAPSVVCAPSETEPL